MSTASMTDNTLHDANANRRAAWIWGSVIIGLLGLQILIGVVSVKLATGDDSVAVVADYHEKALNWNAVQAERAENDRLGWQVTIEPSPGVDALGQRTVIVGLQDKEGKPIENATIRLSTFHHARGNAIHHCQMRDMTGGHYAAEVPMKQLGLWEFSLEVDHVKEHFSSEQTLRLTANSVEIMNDRQ